MELPDPLFVVEMRSFQKKHYLDTEEIITRNMMDRFAAADQLFHLAREYRDAVKEGRRQALARRYAHLSSTLVTLTENAVE